ncbi:arginase family protein [Sphingomonas sp. SUN039]|uniref:arginase family protein n=1 Tax=Sphingomonas sp. SUN039 TaxID=2937787 RepID=UPI00216439B0|nr:arginase family protein [Sphingomonas sp. SUN039]UVO53264.1 arginase family protein [Sphingomonas sp. SUN039]
MTSLSLPVVALIGAPTDCHSSFIRGAALAPAAIRAALSSDHGNAAAESGVELGIDLQIDDRSDVPLADTLASTATDDALLFNAVIDAMAANAMPLVLGGDHAITVPVVAALDTAHGPLTILHFDAHPDLYDSYGDDPRSHASPFARILEAGHAKRLVQVGIRTLNRHCREQAARFGVEVIEMRHFSVDAVPILDGPLYISIDMDGFDPSVAPGVAHLEPGGLTVREVLAVLDRQTAPLVGADIVELCPPRDPTGVTAILAAKLVRELAALYVRNGGGS